MAAKLRALTLEDAKKLGKPIIGMNSSNLDSFDILADYNVRSTFSDQMIEKTEPHKHSRNYIRLVRPTFNFVLAQSNAEMLRNILGVDNKTWDGIVHFQLAFDLTDNVYVEVNDMEHTHELLFGAEIAKYLIDKFDIQEAKVDCLYSVFEENCRLGANVREVVSIDKNSSGIPLVDKYYAHYIRPDLAAILKRGRAVADIEENFADELFSTNNSRFSLLTNMPQDKRSLYGMLNEIIMIVPQDIRPKMDNMEHKLTALYSKVLKANNKLNIELNNKQKDVYMNAYRALEIAVENLQYKNVSKKKADDLSIMERIKTKKGQIRNKNLGKRQDYSGRAVVCINPYLPIDVIRVPEAMLPKLFQYHVLPYLAEGLRRNKYDYNHDQHTANIYDNINLNNLSSPEAIKEILRIINEERILDKVPIVMGRQPTLHKQSLQGFHVEATPFSAIEVSPLVCPAFNMDFDGDQAHLEVPLSDAAVQEVNDLILTTQNLFLPKTGDCTTEPRQEMLYGLWTCTRDIYTKGTPVGETYSTYYEVRDAVMYNKVKVWDTVNCLESNGPIIAGDAAVIACFPPGDIAPRGTSANGKMALREINKKSISDYIDYLLRTQPNGQFVHPIGTGFQTGKYKVSNPHHNTSTFVGAIDALVELGFRVARIYPLDLSLINDHKSLPTFDNAEHKFHKDMEAIDLVYNLGLETANNYKIEFSEHLDELNATKRNQIIDKLGDDNGYVKLSVSGARGSTDNLLQSFAIKGQVKKNATESFDALIEHSYASQLTPLEHFVAAYGGRQGQIDKSLKTGDTGYAMRLMWHATQGLHITQTDCGTSHGLEVSKKELAIFVNSDDAGKISQEVSEIFKHTIVGRFQAGSNRLITEADATRMANDSNFDKIVIRSPLTCNNPCCAKCYGIDWSTRKVAVPGLPVGIIAAQVIGESGTQLSLDQFHKGGIAEEASSMSAFDKVYKYICMSDIAKAYTEGKYPSYDPVAWDSGTVVKVKSSVIGKDKVTIDGPAKSKKSIEIPSGVTLKTTVEKGEGLAFTHGDYDVHEILTYKGIDAAQRYLMFKLYSLFKSEFNIKIVHFECLVASMTRYMIVNTDRKDLMVGQYATAAELHRGSTSNTKYIARLIGVKALPLSSHSALDGIIMENQVSGLSHNCLLEMSDDLDKPINSIVLGKPGNYGSQFSNFVQDRKEKI